MGTQEFRSDKLDRQRIGSALCALAWAVTDKAMSPEALRRGLGEIDTMARGATPAMDALITAHQDEINQQRELFHD
ncbi:MULTISPECIES: hypothetical protein [unclassified Ruegeria]|uniref:hypothetical protein n=1 Tax=unclassified Ruegeria TaxID=2625375 RepID=UPI00147CA070|nr:MULTISPECIES: hypothetical protein [unclassified Ruegeria]